MQRHMFPSPHAHPQLQPVHSIEPSHSFPIHEPALTPQQHPNALIAKPRSGVSQIPNP